MLIIQRTAGTSILINDGINPDMKIKVLEVYHDSHWGKMVKLGFDFPESYKIYREELALALKLGVTLDEARQEIYHERLMHRSRDEEYNR